MGEAEGRVDPPTWYVDGDGYGEPEADVAGYAVAGGDLDSDGFSDILVGAVLSDIGATDAGAACLVFGAPSVAR